MDSCVYICQPEKGKNMRIIIDMVEGEFWESRHKFENYDFKCFYYDELHCYWSGTLWWEFFSCTDFFVEGLFEEQ